MKERLFNDEEETREKQGCKKNVQKREQRAKNSFLLSFSAAAAAVVVAAAAAAATSSIRLKKVPFFSHIVVLLLLLVQRQLPMRNFFFVLLVFLSSLPFFFTWSLLPPSLSSNWPAKWGKQTMLLQLAPSPSLPHTQKKTTTSASKRGCNVIWTCMTESPTANVWHAKMEAQLEHIVFARCKPGPIHPQVSCSKTVQNSSKKSFSSSFITLLLPSLSE